MMDVPAPPRAVRAAAAVCGALLVVAAAGCGGGGKDGPARTFSVTPSATNATASPATAQVVTSGASASFSVTPAANHAVSQAVGGTCPAGSWSGDTYATGPITADCTVYFAGELVAWEVTATTTGGVSTSPAGGQLVPHGSAATFSLAADVGYLVSSAVGGDCPPGAWSGEDYSTGPITAACTVAFARGCEHCAGTCIAAIAPPAPLADPGDGEVCTTPCAVEASVAPRCGTCETACGLGQSCVNGACRCLEGAPTCRPTRALPTCSGRPGGCPFFANSDLDAVTTLYSVVEVDGAVDTDVWVHVDPLGLFPDGTYYPYVMGCQEGRGTLYYPRNQEQKAYFDAGGAITDLAGLERTTTTTRFCRSFEEGPIFSFLSSVEFPHGYYVKFRPGPGESGYAYQVMSVAMFAQAEANSVMHVVDYVIHVLPSPEAEVTVTSSAAAPLAVTPAGDQALAHGATPSFTVTGGAAVVRGTCPRGAWSGEVYSITEPLVAGCTVDFLPAIAVEEVHSPDVNVTPAGVRTVAAGTPLSYVVTSTSTFEVAGTCPAGTWSAAGSRYTTGPITAPCTVEFTSPSACLGADACEPAFDAQAAATFVASPYYGDAGGVAFGPDVCPAGHALVGLAGGHDGNVGWLAAECSFVAKTVTDGVTAVRVDPVAPRRLALHGSGSPPPFTLRCPPDALVTRVDGYADATAPGGPVTAGLHELSVYCSALSWSGAAVTLDAPALVGTAASSWSMAASQPFSYECPAGMVMGALEGRSGAWIDGVGFRCYPFLP